MIADDARQQNNQALARMLRLFAEQDRLFEQPREPLTDTQRNQLYAQSALTAECATLASTGEGSRNAQLFRSAAAVANLVAGGGIDRGDAEAALLEAARTCGLMEGEERAKTLETVGRAFTKGLATPRAAPAKPAEEHRDDPSTSDDPLDQYATVTDLIRAGSEITWLWNGWLPRNVLTILAASPGCGKTRWCMDLTRRISKGLPWPDGQESTCPVGSRTLWVPADSQHPELATIAKDFGIDPDLMFLNATKRNPYGGTMLDSPADLKFFEQAIATIQPQIVFIDTSLNATDRTAHKPEDAKAFFVPLAKIAQRQGVAIVCVTHLNSDGKPLGKRIEGQGRVVIQLEKPDPNQEHRRKLCVTKSNSLLPAPLGVTMATAGNEYDTNPPQKVEAADGHSRQAISDGVKACMTWLTDKLAGGPMRVRELRTFCEQDGISSKTLYAAQKQLKVIETEDDRHWKWWGLPPAAETQF